MSAGRHGKDKMMRHKKHKTPKVSTVIGQGTAITGDVAFAGGLHLDGEVCGNLSTTQDASSTLIVSEKGRVEGDVHVDTLILNGTIVGDVYVNERVELAAQARVTGTVHYRMLEMAMGAEVNGQLVRMDEHSATVAPLATSETDVDPEAA